MADRIKELILKGILVLWCCLFFMLFPVSFILSFFAPGNYIDYFSIAILFVGIIFIILLHIFGWKVKPIPAENFPLKFTNYNEFANFLDTSLIKQGYKKQKSIIFGNQCNLSLYIRRATVMELNCITLLKVEELNDELLNSVDEKITEFLIEYYGTKYINNRIHMIPIVCVDRITPTFRNVVNSNIVQDVKKILLPVGVSFGSKRIYMARQKYGFGIFKYRQQRKYFLEIMNLKEEERIDKERIS